ncbi:MAG: OsmC family protein [Acidobacteria bacterium]|nr:OsmC family protein [Acidobacteriota bacterium]
MHVHLTHESGLSFKAVSRDHEMVSDQPRTNGGEDKGMTPPEWFLASLGSCVGFYAVKYCEARDLDSRDLRIEVEGSKSTEKPIRIASIEIRVCLPFELSERHRAGLKRAVDSCIIHNTLTHAPNLTTLVRDGCDCLGPV